MPEQEVEKLKKLLRMYEGILRTSRNPEQISRVRKEIANIKRRLDQIAPGWEKEEEKVKAPTSSFDEEISSSKILSRIERKKLSPSCDDEELNLGYTILVALEEEFFPALSGSKLKLDYARSVERDGFYPKIESLHRLFKTLGEIVEDYSKAIREDIKLQLKETKERQKRAALMELGELLRKLRDFVRFIRKDIEEGGNVCLNKEDVYSFERYEKGHFLNGKKIPDGLKDIEAFLEESLRALNLPVISKE